MRTRLRSGGFLALGGVALLLAACRPVPSPAPPPPPPAPAVQPPAPAAFTALSHPAGAATPGTSEWYWAPAPGGHAVTIGVYRPNPVPASPVTVLILHGGDGLRRLHEDLAARYAAQGFIAIAGCWFDHQPQNSDQVACTRGPTFQGANSGSVADLDALLDAVSHVPGVDVARLVVVGHSYGATVALDRAAAGHTEPIISVSGFLARSPLGLAVPLNTDVFPADPGQAALIAAPLLIVHAQTNDGITPFGQAQALDNALTTLGRPPDREYWPHPVSHASPWQTEAFPGGAGETIAGHFVAATTAWIHTQYP